jgi:hypothetical protein
MGKYEKLGLEAPINLFELVQRCVPKRTWEKAAWHARNFLAERCSLEAAGELD